jgi:hypothetical protein
MNGTAGGPLDGLREGEVFGVHRAAPHRRNLLRRLGYRVTREARSTIQA